MLEGGYALFQHKSVDRHVEFVAEFVWRPSWWWGMFFFHHVFNPALMIAIGKDLNP
jgi:hypothetical protein